METMEETLIRVQAPHKWCRKCGWSGRWFGSICPECGGPLDGDSRHRESEAGPDAYLREMMNAAELGEDVDWAGVFTVIDAPAEALEPAIENDYEWLRGPR